MDATYSSKDGAVSKGLGAQRPDDPVSVAPTPNQDVAPQLLSGGGAPRSPTRQAKVLAKETLEKTFSALGSERAESRRAVFDFLQCRKSVCSSNAVPAFISQPPLQRANALNLSCVRQSASWSKGPRRKKSNGAGSRRDLKPVSLSNGRQNKRLNLAGGGKEHPFSSGR